MSFEKLLAELGSAQTDTEALAKSMAAATGGDEDGDEEEDKEKATGGDGDGDECATGDKPMTKSMTVKLPDGTEVEAVDGTELVKSLTERLESTVGDEGSMTKAMGQVIDLIKVQGSMIKSLSEQVAKLSTEGRGRRAVLNVHERAPAGTPAATGETLAKGGNGAASMTAGEFMAKSQSAFANKRISGLELTTIDVSLRSGQPVDKELISKVVAD